jgi:hypothetical protein
MPGVMEAGSSYEATKQQALIEDCMLVQSIAARHMRAILFTIGRPPHRAASIKRSLAAFEDYPLPA